MNSIDLHRKNHGKIAVVPKIDIINRDDLSLVYTPGVADVCREIVKNPASVYDLTIKANTVAIITDGSAVLGLGDIGPLAAIPVMEGKAMLLKRFAGIDAFPICLNTKDVDEIVKTIRYITPIFGGINLEDVSAPRCFDVCEKLSDLDIPFMHDDRHGTAIVVFAGLLNALKVVGKNIGSVKVVISGAGAAGSAIAELLTCTDYEKGICRSVGDVIVCDTKGIIHKNRDDVKNNKYKMRLAEITNKKNISGKLEDAMKGADVFIGVSAPNIVSGDMVKTMNIDSIVFAMANPVPEIMPGEAKKAGARIVASGRSDFPNQINNVLAFPGVFRGAMDARAKKITSKMRLAAAYAIAGEVKNPTEEKIIPDPFDMNSHRAVAEAVRKAALIID